MVSIRRNLSVLLAACSIVLLILTIIISVQFINTQFSFDDSNFVNNTIKDICNNRSRDFKLFQKGEFWVLQNYIAASTDFACHESITLTTNSDFTFLNNLPAAIEHWLGPLSLAIYAPGEDFFNALESIAYLRNCHTPLIKKFVTFHLFFDSKNFPSLPENSFLTLLTYYKDYFNCRENVPPYTRIPHEESYRRKNNLTFPINVARNIAIEASQTHWILPLDIELYPSKNFIPKFLDMINNASDLLNGRNVYVLPHFEVGDEETVPRNKTDLVRMLETGSAIPFHSKVCSYCHKLPFSDEWVNSEETEGLNVFRKSKRQGNFSMLEPFFVSTLNEPLFDERYSWEGQSNKMPQGYALCLLDYDYLILDNAFLVHKPGIKYQKEQHLHFADKVRETNTMQNMVIEPEMNALYGARDGCRLHDVKKVVN